MASGPQKHMPYRLLLVLLYGQHQWIERTQNDIIVPVPRISNYLRTRSHRIHEYLEQLRDMGFLEFKWHKSFVRIVVRPPVGMAPSGDVIDVQ